MSGVLPNSYHLNNGLRLDSNPKQISSISPKGYKVAFQRWKIKLMKVISMSRMGMLDLKNCFALWKSRTSHLHLDPHSAFSPTKRLSLAFETILLKFPIFNTNSALPALPYAEPHTHSLMNTNTSSNLRHIIQVLSMRPQYPCAHFTVRYSEEWKLLPNRGAKFHHNV